MSVSSVLRAAFARYRITQKGLAEKINRPEQSVRNKLARNSFTTQELIIIAEALDCKVALLKKQNDEIFESFSIEDAED